MKTKAYIQEFLSPDNLLLQSIFEEQKNRRDVEPNIGMDVGKLMGLLIRLTQAKRVLEFGTCLGYSTIWLAEALQTTGGKLISVEYDEKLFHATKENLEKARLSHVVELIHGDAKTIAEELEGPFDLILQDSDKRIYPDMLERCIQLVRLNGLIIADDALFKPMGIFAELSEPVHRYNELAFSDERLYTTLLPIGDGMTISVKVKND